MTQEMDTVPGLRRGGVGLLFVWFGCRLSLVLSPLQKVVSNSRFILRLHLRREHADSQFLQGVWQLEYDAEAAPALCRLVHRAS